MRWHNHMRMGRPETRSGIYSARFFISKTWGWLFMTMHKKKKKSVAWQQCNTVKYNLILCLSLFAEKSKDEKEKEITSLYYWQDEALMWSFSVQCLLNKNVIFFRKQKTVAQGPLKALVEICSQKWDVTLGEKVLDITALPWYKLWRN